MPIRKLISVGTFSLLLVSCTANTKPPKQVIYRFDEHRYLELVGYNCEGALWYHDSVRGIHTELYDGIFAQYRIFTKKYVHPSEKYIVVPGWEPGGYSVSKDYGQTWKSVGYTIAAYPEVEFKDGHSVNAPAGADIENVTVVNDQGFIMTKQGHLYMSSKPFDDPRTLLGGPGIDYTYYDDVDKKVEASHLRPESSGYKWGMTFVTKYKNNLDGLTFTEKAEYKDLPDKIPEIKDYKGWSKMQCDMNVGEGK